MARGKVAQAQAVQEDEITGQESMELVKCLLRVSIYHVSFLRGLFPEKYFRGVDMTNLDSMHIKMLAAADDEAQMLIDWVERGVIDAIQKRYLKRLYFGFSEDPEATRLLEEYVFSFSYDERGYVSFEMGARGQKFESQMSAVKYQVVRLMRMLVQLTQTLEQVPDERFLFMKLTYHDHTPEDYEPPHFVEASDDSAHAVFPRKPFSMEVGKVATKHHQVALHVKSVLDSMALEGDEQVVAENWATTLHGATTLDTSRLPAGSGDGSVAAMSEDGCGREAVEDDDDVSCCGGAGAAAKLRAATTVPAVHQQAPLDDLYTEPQEVAAPRTAAPHKGGAMAPAGASEALEGSPASPRQVEQELSELRAWLARRTKVHMLDALARWGNISSARLEGYFRALMRDGVLRPVPGDAESYEVDKARAAGKADAGGAPAGAEVEAAAEEQDLGRAMAGLNVGGGGGGATSRPPKAAAAKAAKAGAPQSSEQGGVWAAAGSEMTQSVLAPAAKAGRRGRQEQEEVQPASVFFESTQPSQAGAAGRRAKMSRTKETIKQTGKRGRQGEGSAGEAPAAAGAGKGAAAGGSAGGKPRKRATRARKGAAEEP